MENNKHIIIGIVLGISLAFITIVVTKTAIFKKDNSNSIKENEIIEKNNTFENNENIEIETTTKNITNTTTTTKKATSNNNKNSNTTTTTKSITNNNNTDNNSSIQNNQKKLNLDLYYASTCPHCHAFLEYYDTLDENIKSKIIFNKYEITINENANKYLEVVKKINSDCGGVPLIVFNEEDSMCGFSDSLKDTFTEKLRKYITID